MEIKHHPNVSDHEQINSVNEPAQQAADPIKSQMALSFLDINDRFDTPSSLTEEAKQYLNRLIAIVHEKDGAITTMNIFTDMLEATVFIDSSKSWARPIIFTNPMYLTSEVPIAESIPALIEKLKTQTRYKVLESIIVTPEDYLKVDNMARIITNGFIITSGLVGTDITMAHISGMECTVSTNMHRVRAFMDMHSPHGVRARDDIGFVVYAQRPEEKKRRYGMNEQPVNPRGIIGVTGFTEFIPAGSGFMVQNNMKFIPIIRITEIISTVPHKNLLPLIMLIATEKFIVQMGYLKAFQDYTKDRPNIGALIPDNDGNPWHAKDVNARNDFISNCLLPPYLAIDVVEGRSRIPGIDKLIYNPGACVKEASIFFGTPASSMTNPVQKIWPEYLGFFHDGTGIRDGRFIDYLRLAVDFKDIGRIREFLIKKDLPQARVNEIINIGYNEYKPVYKCLTAVLHSQYLSEMSRALMGCPTKLNLTYEQDDGGMGYNPSLIDGSGNDFGNFGSISGNIRSGWNYTRKSPYEW